MEEVQRVFADLIKDKNRNRNLVFGLTIGTTVIVLGAFTLVYFIYMDATQTMYSKDEWGNVGAFEKVKSVTELPEEAKLQAAYWFSTYYTFHFSNMEKKREAGLYLIDESDGFALEQKWKDWFEKVRMESLTQTAELQENSVKIAQLKNEVYQIEAKALFSVINANFMNTYELQFTTKAKRVERTFPRNPHGFIFFDYTDKLTLVEQDITLTE